MWETILTLSSESIRSRACIPIIFIVVISKTKHLNKMERLQRNNKKKNGNILNSLIPKPNSSKSMTPFPSRSIDRNFRLIATKLPPSAVRRFFKALRSLHSSFEVNFPSLWISDSVLKLVSTLEFIWLQRTLNLSGRFPELKTLFSKRKWNIH